MGICPLEFENNNNLKHNIRFINLKALNFQKNEKKYYPASASNYLYSNE
jgi:hypothetical protein